MYPTAAIGEPEEDGEKWGAIMVGVLQGPSFSECGIGMSSKESTVLFLKISLDEPENPWHTAGK